MNTEPLESAIRQLESYVSVMEVARDYNLGAFTSQVAMERIRDIITEDV